MSVKIGAKFRVVFDGTELEELLIETGEQTLFLDRDACERLQKVLACKGATLGFAQEGEYYPEYVLSFWADERVDAHTEYSTPEVSLRPGGEAKQ